MGRLLGRSAVPLLAISSLTEGGRYSLEGKTRLMKLVFLAQRETPGAIRSLIQPDSPYVFEPYYFGPFSKAVLEDLEHLELSGLLGSKTQRLDPEGRIIQTVYWVTPTGQARLVEACANRSELRQIEAVLHKYSSMKGADLVRYVHREYPEMTRVSDIGAPV